MNRISTPHRILIIRRDNIGDLICTTPLFAALRQQWPTAWIGVLANRYNAPILAGNPDIDAVFAYEKAKHRAAGRTRLAVWRDTAALLWRLRRMRFDLVLCASPGARRFAPWLGAKRIIETDRKGEAHEVEITSRLLGALGIETALGPLVLSLNLQQAELLRTKLGLSAQERRIAIHLSARKLRQRWPENRFTELIRRLLSDGHADRILLFWAPGAEDDALHPGDDGKAARLVVDLADLPVTPVPTHELSELVAGLSLADAVICSDGGAMHIAAGLGKPILCFFGNSSANRWHPWGVPYQLLQKFSQDVADISVTEALSAFARLPRHL
jgi:heptosyltransferase-3